MDYSTLLWDERERRCEEFLKTCEEVGLYVSEQKKADIKRHFKVDPATEEEERIEAEQQTSALAERARAKGQGPLPPLQKRKLM